MDHLRILYLWVQVHNFPKLLLHCNTATNKQLKPKLIKRNQGYFLGEENNNF